MYVDEVELTDFRAIAASRVGFVHPRALLAARLELPNINVVLGTNGAGKSTLLKGVAAAVVASLPDHEWLAGNVASWPRIGGTAECKASVIVRVHPRDGSESIAGDTVVTLAVRVGRDAIGQPQGLQRVGFMSEAVELAHFLIGYGSQREAAAPPETRDIHSDRVASLFDDAGLMPPESWVYRLRPQRRNEVLDLINALLPADTIVEGSRGEDSGALQVSQRGVRVPRTALSDGMQSFLAWIFDLVYRLHQADPRGSLTETRGTVLVDEIDQRMHPSWQQTVLHQLSATLPALQFICAAHSPLLAADLRPENITLLEPDPDAPGEGAMKAVKLSEDLFGRTADGVLTSSYFGLVSTRSDQFRAQLRRLSAAAHRDDTAALEFLSALSQGSRGEVPSPDEGQFP